MSRWLLNISREGDSTNSLGNLKSETKFWFIKPSQLPSQVSLWLPYNLYSEARKIIIVVIPYKEFNLFTRSFEFILYSSIYVNFANVFLCFCCNFLSVTIKQKSKVKIPVSEESICDCCKLGLGSFYLPQRVPETWNSEGRQQQQRLPKFCAFILYLITAKVRYNQ